MRSSLFVWAGSGAWFPCARMKTWRYGDGHQERGTDIGN
jgi:hypothetical protein